MILLTLLAHADVGPAPKCPEGTHSQYLYGRHCPRDGFHMEAQPDGGVIEVADGATAPTPPTEPPTVPPATDPPSTVAEVPPTNPTVAEVPPATPPEPPAATPPEAPPATWCSTTTTSSGVLLMLAGLVAGWTRRRAPRTDS